MEVTKEGHRLQVITWQNVPWVFHEECGSFTNDAVVARSPTMSKTSRREPKSKERVHVHFGDTQEYLFDGEPFLMTTKRKAESELPF